jgi:hypothetical protein
VTYPQANELYEFVGMIFAESELGFNFNDQFRCLTRNKNFKRDLRKLESATQQKNPTATFNVWFIRRVV